MFHPLLYKKILRSLPCSFLHAATLALFFLCLPATKSKAQSYMCGGSICRPEFRPHIGGGAGYDTIVVFGGVIQPKGFPGLSYDYGINFNLPIYKFPDLSITDRSRLSYGIDAILENNTPKSIFFWYDGNRLQWSDSLKNGTHFTIALTAYNSKDTTINGVQSSIIRPVGKDTFVISVDYPEPTFNYSLHIDTAFVGKNIAKIFAQPENVRGADTIFYRIEDTSFSGGAKGFFDNWLNVDGKTGFIRMRTDEFVRDTGVYTIKIQAYRRSDGTDKIRPDGLGMDYFTLVVVDTPVIKYADTVLLVGSADGYIRPIFDDKNIPYVFTVDAITPDPSNINNFIPGNGDYSIHRDSGIFYWKKSNFTSVDNKYTVRVKLSTNRYGGASVSADFHIKIIDTPWASYKNVTVDYDTMAARVRRNEDTIAAPSRMEWRGDTGRLKIVELEVGYTDKRTNKFVRVSIDRQNIDELRPYPGIRFDTLSGVFFWDAILDAYEYRFKVIAINKAGASPKRGGNAGEQDTAVFILKIDPGAPTIRYPKGIKEFIYDRPNQVSDTPTIDWKGIPLGRRKMRIFLDSFIGSLDYKTYGLDTQQSRIEGLLLDSAKEQNPGRYYIGAYPKNLRAGRYYLKVFVWDTLVPEQVGYGTDTFTVLAVAPRDLRYALTLLTTDDNSYNAIEYWRAHPNNNDSLLPRERGIFPYWRRMGDTSMFKGDAIDSGKRFNSGESQIAARFYDGGDTVCFFIDSSYREDQGVDAEFRNGFSIESIREGSFNWTGKADEAQGNIATKIDRERKDNRYTAAPDAGIKYVVRIALRNSVDTISDLVTFEVFKPRPILFYDVSNPLQNRAVSFYKPIDGTTETDTTILPLDYPGRIVNGHDQWYYASGRNGGRPSYRLYEYDGLYKIYKYDFIKYSQSYLNSVLRLDTSTIGYPILHINRAARSGIFSYGLQAVNSVGIPSIEPDHHYLIHVIDTARGNIYRKDTMLNACGFNLDSNFIDAIGGPDDNAYYAEFGRRNGYAFNLGYRRRDSRKFEVANVIDSNGNKLDPRYWDKTAPSPALSFKYADPTAEDKPDDEKSKLYIRELDENGNRIFTIDMPYRIVIRITNALTRGENGLPERKDAYETDTFTLLIQSSAPSNLRYKKDSYIEKYNRGGEMLVDTVDWHCGTGKFYLADTAGQNMNGKISIDTLTGTIRWEKTLAVNVYNFKAVAKSATGEVSFSLRLEILIAPPENYHYTPDTIIGYLGKSDTTSFPEIEWNGSVGNYLVSLQNLSDNGLTNNQIGISSQTGKIYWSKDVPVGTYRLEFIAVNGGGKDTAIITLKIIPSVPFIRFVSNFVTSAEGDSGRSEAPIVVGAGDTPSYRLLATVAGIRLSDKGEIVWSTGVEVGSHQIGVIVSNNEGSDTAMFTLIVYPSKPTPKPSLIEEYTVFPNPVAQGGDVTVRYSIPERSTVTISILNLYGQEVKRAFERTIEAGAYDKVINVVGLLPGIYFIEVETETDKRLRRIVIGR